MFIIPDVASAVGGYLRAQAAHLATLSPQQREAYHQRQRELRENAALEASPEVQLARQYIASDDLRGEHATRLLDFARELARRRVN